MLSAVSIEPNYKNDNLYGFVIRSGKERALFKEIGLQSGGVILSINHIETQQLILNACSIKKRA
ncbi:hypothetical protein [Abyssogena phaseoliformis symbiont]|uniref:hypothetical protein n=1 Tax=Abyssogena phaseoliformis symbiont TaxID=596095 RepID=UPI0019167476|nr:hypothetical protein [Abyssogena phaseoliformis symbiont]